MNTLQKSKQIYQEAVDKFNPTAVVALVSGGNDSAAAYHVAKEIGAEIDYIIHINTRTGIKETTEFVRDYYGKEPPQYIEADAGDAYEKYVLRKGFFGRGGRAHEYAWHLLKADPLRHELSVHIRKRRRNIKILLLNGARLNESNNRKINLPDVYNIDPKRKGNIWVNIIHHWTQEERDQYLKSRNVPINPVAKALCRSGECMCGTMQSQAERLEAKILYPEWGEWLDDLEEKVMEKFPWAWGRATSKSDLDQYDLFLPMCGNCIKRAA